MTPEAKHRQALIDDYSTSPYVWPILVSKMFAICTESDLGVQNDAAQTIIDMVGNSNMDDLFERVGEAILEVAKHQATKDKHGE